MMFRVAAEIRAMSDEFVELLCLDSGKPLKVAKGEVNVAARYFEYYGGMSDKIEGRSIPLGPGYVNYTIPSPYGVSGQVVPWNFPAGLTSRSLATAMATGNSVVVKSPELAPLAVCLMRKPRTRPSGSASTTSIFSGLSVRNRPRLISAFAD